MKQTSLILIFFFYSKSIIAQNYLYNPGFEAIPSEFEKEYDNSNPDDIKYAGGCRSCFQSWRTGNKGIPAWNRKYFVMSEIYDNPLSSKRIHPDKAFGKSFAWIMVKGEDNEGKARLLNPQSSYLETKLKKSLSKGKKYNVSFQIALHGGFINFSVNNIGILFTEVPINLDTLDIINIEPQIQMESIVDTSGDFALFQETFVAEKDYNYLTFGFFPVGKSKLKQYIMQDPPDPGFDLTESKRHPFSSFYIDEIQIVEMMDPAKLQKAISSRVNIKNIQFETNKAILTPIGKMEIDKLIKLMEELPYLKISIEGHTDDEGELDYNIELSNKRADAIRNYIHLKGIGLDRLRAKGFGETVPLLPNTNDENRSVNRRVEIKAIN